jgi:hypothetical protein
MSHYQKSLVEANPATSDTDRVERSIVINAARGTRA